MSFKNKNIVRGFPFFTHFACIPFADQEHRQYVQNVQQMFQSRLTEKGFNVQENLKRHNHLLSHVTMCMLTLKREDVRKKLAQILDTQKEEIIRMVQNLTIVPGEIKYFTRCDKNKKCQELTVVYLQIDQKSKEILNQFVDYLVRILLKYQIVLNEQLRQMRISYDHKVGKFYPQTFHISLFRCRNLMQSASFLQAYERINEQLREEMKSTAPKFKCKSLDISTMMEFDADGFYLPFARIGINKKQDFEKISQIKQETIN